MIFIIYLKTEFIKYIIFANFKIKEMNNKNPRDDKKSRPKINQVSNA